jgi:AcrR family transcriptional regulator
MDLDRCSPGDYLNPDGDRDTRQRLLCAARDVFAAKGMAATVRDVCTLAQANVAAVHYHFGSKETLLAEVLRRFLAQTLAFHPMDGGVPPGASVEERLYGFVFAFMCRVLRTPGNSGQLAQILSGAFVRPLPAFEPCAQAHRQDVRAVLGPIMEQIIHTAGCAFPQADSAAFEMLGRSIVGQILYYNTNRDELLAQRQGEFTSEELRRVARHITRFSLGGLNHVAEWMECKHD